MIGCVACEDSFFFFCIKVIVTRVGKSICHCPSGAIMVHTCCSDSLPQPPLSTRQSCPPTHPIPCQFYLPPSTCSASLFPPILCQSSLCPHLGFFPLCHVPLSHISLWAHPLILCSKFCGPLFRQSTFMPYSLSIIIVFPVPPSVVIGLFLPDLPLFPIPRWSCRGYP